MTRNGTFYVQKNTLKQFIKDMEDYAEVRCDFYDDIDGYWCVDAWRTNDNDEEGEVVAHVYNDGSVVYLDKEAKQSAYVKAIIKECLMEIKDNK